MVVVGPSGKCTIEKLLPSCRETFDCRKFVELLKGFLSVVFVLMYMRLPTSKYFKMVEETVATELKREKMLIIAF